jgi:hypothetical protein
MAEKSKDKKSEKKPHHHSSGGVSFGMEIILFIVAIFILWVLTGGTKKEAPQSPLLVPNPEPMSPLGEN